MTEYIILRLDTERPRALPDENPLQSWQKYGGTEATSPARALRNLNLAAGEYVAVPARSWKPLTVTVEQTTKVTIG